VSSSSLEELYGLIDPLMDLDHGLYESIGVHEMSTLNLKQTYCHVTIFLKISKLTFLFIKKIGFHHDLPFVIIFWCFFRVWVDNSWRVLCPYWPFDQSRSWSIQINWCSWVVHPRSKKTYHHGTIVLNLSKQTFCL
jgi:hypothetical protein